ncbi:MAG: NPCBM/NEW2 domain-containing protein, partial [Planctomycetota bacterium]|nr:NPCBM/NEW2 domain-containing protein [Planctomycetota bacterium]
RRARGIVKDAEKDLAKLESSRNPFTDKRGIFLKSYHSKLDGGFESYFVDIPYGYTAEKEWPLVFQLHGHVGLGIPFQQAIPDHREDCITVAPHGKGSIDYKWVAEQEILQVLDEVRAAYRIDPDRIYIQGHSMGGTGAFSLAAHYPHLFAAISSSAGNSDHKVWEKLWESPEMPQGSPLKDLRNYLEDADSSISYAENFINTKVYCVHGAIDDINPVEHSRNMVARLKEFGCPVEYDEIALAPHSTELLTSAKSQFEWLLKHRRQKFPVKVRVKASRLKHGRNAWVRITAFEDLLKFAVVDAEKKTDSLHLKTENVSELELEIPDEKVREVAVKGRPYTAQSGERHPGKLEIQIAIDGQSLGAEADQSESETGPPQIIRLKKNYTRQFGSDPLHRIPVSVGKWVVAEAAREGLYKQAGLEGPIEDAFTSPFIVSYGTRGKDLLENRILQREAEALAEQWRMRFGYAFRLLKDTEVTEEQIKSSNLICYGRPDQHRIVSMAAGSLPLRFEPDKILFEEHRFDGDDLGVKFCYPNPLNPERYIVVFAALSWKGMFQINNRFGNWFDWGAYENRNYFDYAIFDGRTHSPETFVAFGYFNQDWDIRSKYRFDGKEEFRSRHEPRALPSLQKAEGDISNLSDLIPSSISQLQGAVSFNRSYEANPLNAGGKEFEKGFGVRAPSTIEFELDGSYGTFTAFVGVDTEGKKVRDHHIEHNRIQFEVYADDAEEPLATSGALGIGHPPHKLECSMAGVKKLKLVTRQVCGYRWFLLSAAWGEPTVKK